jgi:hypothetical protein
MSSWSA